jgi:membrane dipeptidase
MIIVDAHEDLAFNVLADGRDYLTSAHVTRAAEAGGPVPTTNGLCMLGLPEWLAANIAVIFATVTTIPRTHARGGEPTYPNPEASYQQALPQLAIYRHWAATHPQIVLIERRGDLDAALATWAIPPEAAERRQVGLVLLMENADSIRTPAEVGFWYEHGVRLIGPAWETNRYTACSYDSGPLTPLGRALLDRMQRLGMILDLSHMADEACREALARYDGPVVVTHANPRSLVPLPRLIPDDVIAGIVVHDGVVGIMPLNWALDPTWRKGNPKAGVGIDVVVNAVDVVCDLAGDALHVGIGTDFDGGQGAESAPAELDTVADLPRIADALSRRGYIDEAVEAIMGENWLRVLRRSLP